MNQHDTKKYPFRNFDMLNSNVCTKIFFVVIFPIGESGLVSLVDDDRHFASQGITKSSKLAKISAQHDDVAFFRVAALPEEYGRGR